MLCSVHRFIRSPIFFLEQHRRTVHHFINRRRKIDYRTEKRKKGGDDYPPEITNKIENKQ
jgi:hypothetical protein